MSSKKERKYIISKANHGNIKMYRQARNKARQSGGLGTANGISGALSG